MPKEEKVENMHACNAEDFASSGGFALLLSQPWNENPQGKEIDKFIREEKIIRCEDWKDVQSELERITIVLRHRS